MEWNEAGGYDWINTINEVVKGAIDPLKGQNNANPLGVFGAHVLAKVGGTYYDAAYGRTYASLKEWEDSAVAYYGIAAPNQTIAGVLYQVAYLFKENPRGAGTPADVIRFDPTNY